MSLPAAQRDSVLAHFDGATGWARTTNEEWAAIAREVPGGWGGFFVERDTLWVYLTDPSQREVALAALAGRRGATGFDVDVRQARVRPGRWDFAQLDEWYLYLAPHVQGLGIRESDIQEARNRIEYSVVDTAARTRVERVLAKVDVPCFLVAIDVIGPVDVRGVRSYGTGRLTGR